MIEQLFADLAWVEEMNTWGSALPAIISLATYNVGVGVPEEKIPKFKIDNSAVIPNMESMAVAIPSTDQDDLPMLSVAGPTLSAYAQNRISKYKKTVEGPVQEQRLVEYYVIQSMAQIIIGTLADIDEITMDAIEVELTQILRSK